MTKEVTVNNLWIIGFLIALFGAAIAVAYVGKKSGRWEQTAAVNIGMGVILFAIRGSVQSYELFVQTTGLFVLGSGLIIGTVFGMVALIFLTPSRRN